MGNNKILTLTKINLGDEHLREERLDLHAGERCMENKKILRTRKIYPWRCIDMRGEEYLHTLVDR